MGWGERQQNSPHRAPERVPILGQPFTLVEVIPVAVITCNCEAKHIITISGLRMPSQCPGCQRVYVVMSATTTMDPESGRKDHQASIAIVQHDQAGVPARKLAPV